jgi:hypothetical protein
MKVAFFMFGAALALSSAPAVADDGQVFDHAAQSRAYANTLPRDNAKQCFNGKFITGVNRSGANTLYLQAVQGTIYRVKLADDCDALNAAEGLTVRSNGSDVVCPGDSAEMIAHTAAGSKSCRVSDLRRLSSGEVTALATSAKR